MNSFPAACPAPGLPLPCSLKVILILAGWNEWNSGESAQMWQKSQITTSFYQDSVSSIGKHSLTQFSR